MLLALVLLAQTTAATPAPSPTPPVAVAPATKLGGGFGQKAGAPPKTRVVITDDTMAAEKRGGSFSVSGQPAGTPSPGAKGAPAPHPASDEESSWKSRVSNLRSALTRAEADLDAADKANTVVSFGTPGHDYETLMAIRNAALVPYRTKVSELQRELDLLPEECRKSPGCQPGWVR